MRLSRPITVRRAEQVLEDLAIRIPRQRLATEGKQLGNFVIGEV